MNRRSVLFMTAAMAGLALVTARPAVANHDRYTIIDLGTLPGKANSFAWQQSVNECGDVAAYANDINDPNAFFSDLAFIWSRGTLIPLPGLDGATSTIAYSLNNRGQVCGYSRQDGGFQHGLVWDRGELIQLPELPGDTRANTYTLNDRGQVVGFTRHPDPNLPFALRHAVVWNKVKGAYQAVRLPGLTTGLTGDGYDQALSINEEGKICGESGPFAGAEHAVLWDKKGVHDLGTLGGATSIAIAMNNKDEVVGYSDIPSGTTVPFFWRKGVMTALDVPADNVFGLAQGINSRGYVVGYAQSDPNDVNTERALLWKKGRMIDLVTTLPANSGWQLLQACGINSRGQISGFGLHNGQYRAFLMAPERCDDGDDD